MEINDWAVLVVLTLVGICSLLFAAGGDGGTQSLIGLLVAAAAVVGIFVRVKQYFDRVDASRH